MHRLPERTRPLLWVMSDPDLGRPPLLLTVTAVGERPNLPYSNIFERGSPRWQCAHFREWRTATTHDLMRSANRMGNEVRTYRGEKFVPG